MKKISEANQLFVSAFPKVDGEDSYQAKQAILGLMLLAIKEENLFFGELTCNDLVYLSDAFYDVCSNIKVIDGDIEKCHAYWKNMEAAYQPFFDEYLSNKGLAESKSLDLIRSTFSSEEIQLLKYYVVFNYVGQGTLLPKDLFRFYAVIENFKKNENLVLSLEISDPLFLQNYALYNFVRKNESVFRNTLPSGGFSVKDSVIDLVQCLYNGDVSNYCFPADFLKEIDSFVGRYYDRRAFYFRLLCILINRGLNYPFYAYSSILY